MPQANDNHDALETRIRTAFEAQDFEAAVSQAIEGYGPELLGFLANLLQDHAKASEVFSQTCEDMWVGIGTFQWRSRFRTWAFAVTRRACQRFLSKERRWGYRQLSAVTEPHVLADKVRTATSPYLRTEVKSRVTDLRGQLPPGEQTLLILRVDRNLSWNEVAQIMAGPQQELQGAELKRLAATHRKRFERAKQRLRELVQAAGLLNDDR